MLKKLKFIFVLLVLFLVPSVSHAQEEQLYNEFVVVDFPVSNTTVNTAGDYRIEMVAVAKPATETGSDAVINWLGLYAGSSSPTFNAFMHAGLYVTSDGVQWFAAAAPYQNTAPPVVCLAGTEVWPNPSGLTTGCLSDVGDLGINVNTWIRLQIVTYGNGFWIVRIANPGTQTKIDVARIYNPNTYLTVSKIVMEESWYGTAPGQNPWYPANFYDVDFKYRRDFYWAQWPSNIGGNYGSNNIRENSYSGADVCPAHYGVNNYVQGNPYLWYMGTGGSKCSGLLYTGGGPATEATSIVGEYSGKFMSSENGQTCILTNRTWPGPWEEWNVIHLGINVRAYRGNNAKYITRRSTNDLWAEAADTGSNNARFDYVEIQSLVFRLRNKGNGLYVDHYNGLACTSADKGTFNNQTVFRYVAF
jgi:hypothetical protein